MRPSYRPHNASCLSVPYGLVTEKQKKNRKIKISAISNTPHGTSKWSDNFQLKRSKVKVTGRQKTPKYDVMFTYGRQLRGRCLLHSRPTPLLGLVHYRRSSMRRSATARTAARHVGTRRRHAFLLNIICDYTCSFYRLTNDFLAKLDVLHKKT